ncbi:MAG: metallophosphoesterase [Treponema sp.]|nr:metallophosphoesterase [Treponema sp.]
MKKILFIIGFVLSFASIISCKSSNGTPETVLSSEVKNPVSYNGKKWQNNEGFSIAIIPDSQAYVNYAAQTTSPEPYVTDQWKIYYRQTEFIARNSVQNGGYFSFVLHVGDHVEHSAAYQIEWDLAVKCFANLDGQIPVLTVPGNHDYDGYNRYTQESWGSQYYNKYFGPDSVFFKNKSWYKGSYEDGKNSCAVFDACGKKFLVIGLEVNPDDNAIRWAQKVLDENKNLPAIILTHAYLHFNKEFSFNPDNKNYRYTNARYRRKVSDWTPKKLWNDFISRNNQIFLVICGHEATRTKACSYRIDKNKNGYTTYSVLSDFQFYSDYLKKNNIPNKKKTLFCGDGWFSVLDINLKDKTIDFSCFNSETGETKKGEPFELSFPIDWDWDERLKAE